jgi:hypothetical protein
MVSTMAAAMFSVLLGLAAPDQVTTEPARARPPASSPKELASRGAVLPRGMLEVTVPLGISFSSDHIGQPIFLNPGLSYGVTDDLTIGLRHFLGVCFNVAAEGCPQPYNDFSVEAAWQLWRWRGAEIALGAAVDVAPIDPFTLSAEARLRARWAGGPFAFGLAPSISFGLTNRDGTGPGKRVPIAFPLGSYSFGWFQDVTGNREILTVPAVVQVQVIPSFAAAVGAALMAPLDPAVGDASDYVTFPFGAALVVTPSGSVDVGVSLTFRSLFGREKWPGSRPGEARLAQLFVAIRR